MAGELTAGHALDLDRPELAPVMRRYSSGLPVTPVVGPTALVVTTYPGEEERLEEALRFDGWTVKTCAGPAQEPCPLVCGERCSLRDSAHAAVVYMEPHHLRPENLLRIRCAAAAASPGVIALEGRLDGPQFPQFGGTVATVGALRGPAQVLHAIRALLASARH